MPRGDYTVQSGTGRRGVAEPLPQRPLPLAAASLLCRFPGNRRRPLRRVVIFSGRPPSGIGAKKLPAGIGSRGSGPRGDSRPDGMYQHTVVKPLQRCSRPTARLFLPRGAVRDRMKHQRGIPVQLLQNKVMAPNTASLSGSGSGSEGHLVCSAPRPTEGSSWYLSVSPRTH